MENAPAPQPSIEDRLSAHFSSDETPSAAPEAAPEAAPAEDAPAAVAAEPDDASAPEAKPAEVAADDAGETVDEVVVSSLSELMQNLEATPEDMYALTVPVTVDGVTTDVPLSQLKDNFRDTGVVQRMKDEAKAAREEARARAKESTAQYEATLAQGHALVQTLEQAAMARFQGINWNELRESDPSEWSAKRVEVQQAAAQLQAVKHRVNTQLENHRKQTEAQQAAAHEELMAKERVALDEAWPELADPEKGDAERASLIAEFRSRGFSDEEIGEQADHRWFLMARDAKRYRESVKATDATRKKVVKVGKKVIKPGARQSTAETRQETVRPMRDKLRKSGNWRDAAALLSRS